VAPPAGTVIRTVLTQYLTNGNLIYYNCDMVLKGSTAQALLQHAVQAAAVLVLAGLASASVVSGAAAAPQVAPDAAAIAVSAQNTVEIVATGCGGHRYGSGFAISATQIITNAHVVAGTESVSVKIQGRQAIATVVLFDPSRDVAVLNVSGLNLHALKSSNGYDSSVAAIGYPGGGAETVTAGIVDRQPLVIEVPDIYGNRVTGHQVWVTHANLHPGNSGGPLVDSQGAVMGLVFAASTTDTRVAYAMTTNEIQSDLMAAQGRTQAVASGACI
jgi:S1-C subfamily serine protease